MATRLQPTAKFVTVNGLRLRTLEWGRPGGLPVVCVHGYTSSAEAFNAMARRLQDRAHIVAMDVRGHGESAWSPGAPTNTPTRPRTSRPSSISSGSSALC
jgi:pimeloyl-ACP methyl ester carboxylesterase